MGSATKYQQYRQEPSSRWSIFWNNLVGGIAWGLGSVLGATIVVGILGFLLVHFQDVPILGNVARAVVNIVKEGQQYQNQNK